MVQARMRSPVLYKGDKDVNAAVHSPEGGPAEARGLSVSSLPKHNCSKLEGGEGQTRAEAQAQVVFAGHRPT